MFFFPNCLFFLSKRVFLSHSSLCCFFKTCNPHHSSPLIIASRSHASLPCNRKQNSVGTKTAWTEKEKRAERREKKRIYMEWNLLKNKLNIQERLHQNIQENWIGWKTKHVLKRNNRKKWERVWFLFSWTGFCHEGKQDKKTERGRRNKTLLPSPFPSCQVTEVKPLVQASRSRRRALAGSQSPPGPR